jgi:hypothetical protein
MQIIMLTEIKKEYQILRITIPLQAGDLLIKTEALTQIETIIQEIIMFPEKTITTIIDQQPEHRTRGM